MFFDKKNGVGGWLPTRWQSYLFDRRSEMGTLRSAVSDLRNKVSDVSEDDYSDEASEAREKVGAESKAFGSEVFSRLYGSPERGEGEVDWAVSAHRVLDEMPEFERLKRSVAGDPDFSALATRDLLKVVAEHADSLKEMEKERKEREDDDGDGENPDGDGPPTDGTGNGTAGGMPTAEDMVRSAMRRAIRRAEGEVGDAKEMMNGIAPGMEAAPPLHEQADPTRFHLAERVKDSDEFKKVMEVAGRLRRIASKTKRQRDRSLNEEVVDIERGADLARVLPSEIAGLRHPLMAKLVKRNIVERSLVQYRLEGTEMKGRGPVVVLLDRSGSMRGEPEVWASAVGIAMAGIAAKQKRAITVVGFNGGITSGIHLDTKGVAHTIDIHRDGGSAEKPKKIDGGAGSLAIHIAGEYSGGGTSFEYPIRAAMSLPAGVKDERADLIFVTDGDAYIPEAMMEELMAAKEESGLRVFAMTVNGGSTSEAVQAICDECVDIDEQGDLGVSGILSQ